MRPPETPREVTYSVAEHEILLSFNDDSDAGVFDRWWHKEGRDIFLKFADLDMEDDEDAKDYE